MNTTKDITLPLRLWDWTYLAGEILTSLEHALDHNDVMFFITTMSALSNLTGENVEQSGVIPQELWLPIRQLQDSFITEDASGQFYDAFSDPTWQQKARAFIETYNRAWLKWRDHELGRDTRGIVP